jgi:four helix bundle protein
MGNTRYDLQDRLIEFGAVCVALVEELPSSRAGSHVAGQLLRCSTSPFANYGEALGAESRRDFIHKLRLCLKELRESQAWLRFVERTHLADADRVKHLIAECDELIAIMVSSTRTASKAS